MKWLIALILASVGAVHAAAPTYPPCAESADIDGKGTSEVFGADGWILENYEFQPDEPLSSATIASLTLLAHVLRAHGSNLILVPVPSRAMYAFRTVDLPQYPQLHFSAEAYRAAWAVMIQQVQRSGVHVVDLLPTVLAFKPGARGEAFYYPRDHHWTLSGIELATAQIAAQIRALVQAQHLPLEYEKGVLTIAPRGAFLGTIADHYEKACKTKVDTMLRYEATFAVDDAELLDDVNPVIGIFGDSFGLTYPDNNYAYPDVNFGVLLEAATRLPVVNNAVSGSGKTAAMAGYLADPAVRAHLPTFLVVPSMGGVSNNTFDYGQVTAALMGCTAETTLAKTSYPNAALKTVFAPKIKVAVTGPSVLHIHTSTPTNYLEVREGRYTDGSALRFEFYRITTDYYTGSRTDFYTLLAANKVVDSLSVQLDDQRPIVGYVEWCTSAN